MANDLKVATFNPTEAKILYHEIFTLESYGKYGIEVADGDCIFDIGANIGLYSVSLMQRFNNLEIYAFEPIPEIFSVLQKNINLYANTSKIKAFNIGLSNQPGIAQFQFNRALSLGTSMYSQEMNNCARQDMKAYDWAKAMIQDGVKVGQISESIAEQAMKCLSIPGLRQIASMALSAFFLGFSMFGRYFSRQVNCTLKTVSEMIAENAVDRIDVMKIDTEGSELDVLMGIQKEDWQKIKQFIIEVHDIDHRVDKIKSLLSHYGYRVYISQEDFDIHYLMNIFTIYAIKK